MSKIIAYKAFDKDLKCRGFQYEVGKTYTHEGSIRICSEGFHSCPEPFSVWGYYKLTPELRYGEVEIGGVVETDSEKICSSQLTLKAELSLGNFIKAQVDWVLSQTKKADKHFGNGDFNSVAANGNSNSVAGNGDSNRVAANGNSNSVAANGDYNRVAGNGNANRVAGNGNDNSVAGNGDANSVAGNGNYNSVAGNGNDNRVAGNGNDNRVAGNGNYNSVAGNGDANRVAGNGNYNSVAGNGNYNSVAGNGKNCFVAGNGLNNRARAGEGGAIVLGYWDERPRYAVGYVGENGIKADTWYVVRDGKLVEE